MYRERKQDFGKLLRTSYKRKLGKCKLSGKYCQKLRINSSRISMDVCQSDQIRLDFQQRKFVNSFQKTNVRRDCTKLVFKFNREKTPLKHRRHR